MGVFYIELIPTGAELNFFTYKPHSLEANKVDGSNFFQHSRYIEFRGQSTYSQFGDFSGSPSDLRLEKNGSIMPMPDSSSVLIRNNCPKEDLKLCQYLGSDAESEFQIVVDYDVVEFEVLWGMFSSFDKPSLKAKICVSAELNMNGVYRDIIMPKNKEWILDSFLIQELKDT